MAVIRPRRPSVAPVLVVTEREKGGFSARAKSDGERLPDATLRIAALRACAEISVGLLAVGALVGNGDEVSLEANAARVGCERAMGVRRDGASAAVASSLADPPFGSEDGRNTKRVCGTTF